MGGGEAEMLPGLGSEKPKKQDSRRPLAEASWRFKLGVSE